MQIMHVDPVLDRLETELIGGAVHHAAFDSATGQPRGEAKAVVVTTLGPFGGRSASELTAPDDQCVVEQTARFEILEQRGDWPVALAGVVPMVVDIRVVVPGLTIAIVNLGHAHAALGESPRDETGIGKFSFAIQLARDFSIGVKKLDDGSFIHSNVITLVDKKGQVRKYINGNDEELTADQIVEELNKLL